MTLTVLPDPTATAEAGADRFVAAARRAVEERGTFRVALSGGSTPKAVYPLLVVSPRVEQVAWDAVEFFWGDERAVPPDDPESNFGVAYQMLIARLPGVRREAVHRMPAEQPDIHAAAVGYEADMRLAFEVRADELPVFDLVWLGMGPDGHTASLFPGSDALAVTDRLVVATQAPDGRGWRMTLTLPVINAALEALFIVTGPDKAPALASVHSGSTDLPAARVTARNTEWLADAQAAGRLLPHR